MSEKYQREIEHLLGTIQELPPKETKKNMRNFSSRLLAAAGQLWDGGNITLSPGRVILSSLLLILIAVLFKASMPGLVAPIAWTAVILFIVGYAMSCINPSRTYEKRWRGRAIEHRPGWWERFNIRTKWPRR
ncbi:hypothetical protein M1N24_00205 [Dehalococcoidia bacterium]|nr:hypothetical protein [Dehalococcoidia bacterium]